MNKLSKEYLTDVKNESIETQRKELLLDKKKLLSDLSNRECAITSSSHTNDLLNKTIIKEIEDYILVSSYIKRTRTTPELSSDSLSQEHKNGIVNRIKSIDKLYPLLPTQDLEELKKICDEQENIKVILACSVASYITDNDLEHLVYKQVEKDVTKIKSTQGDLNKLKEDIDKSYNKNYKELESINKHISLKKCIKSLEKCRDSSEEEDLNTTLKRANVNNNLKHSNKTLYQECFDKNNLASKFNSLDQVIYKEPMKKQKNILTNIITSLKRYSIAIENSNESKKTPKVSQTSETRGVIKR